MKALKSPVSKIGGKFFLRHWLVRFIPPHRVYVEPFVGAGHLLFTKPSSDVEVINDIDNHLIAFFKVIQNTETREALSNRLNYMPYARALWQELRAKWKQGCIPDDGIERAAMWFYLNRTCFGGDMLTGGFALPSITGRNPAMSFRTAIDGIEAVSIRLRNVTIENLSYEDCIQRYDSPETLFYIDPPYLDAEDYYGRGNFTYDDHSKLARLLNEVRGKVMITHYQNGLYDDLYKGWHRFEYESFKGSHKAQAGTEKPKTVEVMYCNFNPEQKQNELFKNI